VGCAVEPQGTRHVVAEAGIVGEWERKVCQSPLCAWRARGKWGSDKVSTGGHQHSVVSLPSFRRRVARGPGEGEGWDSGIVEQWERVQLSLRWCGHVWQWESGEEGKWERGRRRRGAEKRGGSRKVESLGEGGSWLTGGSDLHQTA